MNLEVINVIVGAVLPPFIDIINNKVPNSNVRYVISLAISLLIGGVSSYLSGELTGIDLLASGGIIFASAQTTYKLYYGESKLRTQLYGDSK